VEDALKKITALPHLSGAQQKDAKNVIDFVMHTVQEVQGAKGMTKEVKAKKVKEAIAKLQGLEQQWVHKAQNMTAAERRIGELQAKIAEKRQQLTRVEGMLKLDKLKKELLEKKLLLSKLVSQQAAAKEQASRGKADTGAKVAMVKQLSAAAATMAVHANSTKAGEIAAALVMLRDREHSITAAIKALDDTEKASEKEFDGLASKTAGVKDAGVEKAQRMLKNVKKQEHRKIEKAKAAKKAELAEVTEAVKSIEAGDVKALRVVLAKMQKEVQGLDAQTGKFIY